MNKKIIVTCCEDCPFHIDKWAHEVVTIFDICGLTGNQIPDTKEIYEKCPLEND